MTQNKQIEVNSSKEAITYFKKSRFIDCRVSGFSRQEIEEEKPNLIFVDLDDMSALEEVRALFYKTIGGIPTILQTGKGLAVIQPIQMISMKNVTYMGKAVDDPAKKFLHFVERYLTNHKCDSGNHPSLKSCLIRIPGSINSKNMSTVSILQEWDGHRVDVKTIPFKKHLDQLERTQNTMRPRYALGEIPYIENILHSRLVEGRKRVFALILCPYLINVKKLAFAEAEDVLTKYFDGYVPTSMIRYKLREVFKKGILPYGLKNMQENDAELFKLVTELCKDEINRTKSEIGIPSQEIIGEKK